MSKIEIFKPQYGIVDSMGLLAIFACKNNLIKDLALEMLSDGRLRVPTTVWDEFSGAYKDEASSLKKYVSFKVSLRNEHEIQAAILAQLSNSRFRLEPYGNANWIAAGAAVAEKAVLLTDDHHMGDYEAMSAKHLCGLAKLEELAKLLV